MLHQVNELQLKASISKPDLRYANLLLEQFGGPNGPHEQNQQIYGLNQKAEEKKRTEKSVQKKDNKPLNADRKAEEGEDKTVLRKVNK